jgi:hypothetical protein
MSSEDKDEVIYDHRIGLLKIFASIINPSDINEIGITLNVKGTVVSGMMIGMKRYYERMSKVLEDVIKGPSPESAAIAKKEMKRMFDFLKESPSQEKLEGGNLNLTPYI